MADNEVETKGIPSRRDRGDKGYFAKVVAWWRREIVQEVPPELAYCEFECACYRRAAPSEVVAEIAVDPPAYILDLNAHRRHMSQGRAGGLWRVACSCFETNQTVVRCWKQAR